MFVFYRAVPRPGGDGVFYLSRMSRRSVIALYDLRYQLLKLTLVLVVIALIVSLWVTRHIVSPLVRIQDACRAYLTKGSSAPIALARRDEIGDLSRDLDELTRRLQDQATHTRQVTADLAHDLKSPLSTIHASAELLRDSEILDGDRRERIAAAVSQAAAHMSRSVQAMLTLARLDESLPSEHRRMVRIGELVSNVCREFQQDPRNARIRFLIECPIDHAVFGVAERLAQAIHNLVANAVTFCRETVMVQVAAVAGDLVISILDDGPGVSPGNRDKIAMGALHGQALATVFASADVFALASETETFGNVVLEAAASGLPAIVAAAGAAHEHVLDGVTGMVRNGSDPAAFAGAILALFADAPRRLAMGRAARSHAAHHDLRRAVDATWAIYRDVASDVRQRAAS